MWTGRKEVLNNLSKLSNSELAEILVATGCKDCPLYHRCDEKQYDGLDCEHSVEKFLENEYIEQ